MGFVVESAMVQGVSHARAGIERQDYAGHFESETSRFSIAVVADGHGDPTCCRSAMGSRFAVGVATDCLTRFAEAMIEESKRSERTVASLLDSNGGRTGLRRLATAITYEWSHRVAQDFAERPLEARDLERLGTLDRAWANSNVDHLYGSTLIAALYMPGSLVLLQLGDGACAVVFSDGSVEQPLPDDPLCVGNVTTSLSDSNAAQETRVVALDTSLRPFVACVLASDGIEKSVAADGGMSDFAGQLACQIPSFVSEGTLKERLTQTITEVAGAGSLDDASVAIIANVEGIDAIGGELQRRHEVFRDMTRIRWARNRLVSMERKRAFLISQGEDAEGDAERKRYLAEYDELVAYVHELEQKVSAADPALMERLEREGGFPFDEAAASEGVVTTTVDAPPPVVDAEPDVATDAFGVSDALAQGTILTGFNGEVLEQTLTLDDREARPSYANDASPSDDAALDDAEIAQIADAAQGKIPTFDVMADNPMAAARSEHDSPSSIRDKIRVEQSRPMGLLVALVLALLAVLVLIAAMVFAIFG